MSTKILAFANAALPLTFADVISKVRKEHYRIWKTIGTEMGVDVGTLNAIEKDHRNDESRLYAMIDCINPTPTHETFTKVLRSEYVNNTIAGTIVFVI